MGVKNTGLLCLKTPLKSYSFVISQARGHSINQESNLVAPYLLKTQGGLETKMCVHVASNQRPGCLRASAELVCSCFNYAY